MSDISLAAAYYNQMRPAIALARVASEVRRGEEESAADGVVGTCSGS